MNLSSLWGTLVVFVLQPSSQTHTEPTRRPWWQLSGTCHSKRRIFMTLGRGYSTTAIVSMPRNQTVVSFHVRNAINYIDHALAFSATEKNGKAVWQTLSLISVCMRLNSHHNSYNSKHKRHITSGANRTVSIEDRNQITFSALVFLYYATFLINKN